MELVQQGGTECIRGAHGKVAQGVTGGRVGLGTMVVSIDALQSERRGTAAPQQDIAVIQVFDRRLWLAQQMREGMFDHSHVMRMSEQHQISGVETERSGSKPVGGDACTSGRGGGGGRDVRAATLPCIAVSTIRSTSLVR